MNTRLAASSIECLKWFHLDTCSALAEIWDKKKYKLFNRSITEDINASLKEYIQNEAVDFRKPKFLILGPVEYQAYKDYVENYFQNGYIVNDKPATDKEPRWKNYFRGMEVVRGNSGIQFSMYWIDHTGPTMQEIREEFLRKTYYELSQPQATQT